MPEASNFTQLPTVPAYSCSNEKPGLMEGSAQEVCWNWRDQGRKSLSQVHNDQLFLPSWDFTFFTIVMPESSYHHQLRTTYIPTSITEWCLCPPAKPLRLRTAWSRSLISHVIPPPLWCVSNLHCLIWPSSSKERPAGQELGDVSGTGMGRWRRICCLEIWANSEATSPDVPWLCGIPELKGAADLNSIRLQAPTAFDRWWQPKNWFCLRCVIEHLLRTIKQKSSVYFQEPSSTQKTTPSDPSGNCFKTIWTVQMMHFWASTNWMLISPSPVHSLSSS